MRAAIVLALLLVTTPALAGDREVCMQGMIELHQVGLIVQVEVQDTRGVMFLVNPILWSALPLGQKMVFGPIVRCAYGIASPTWLVGLMSASSGDSIGYWTEDTGWQAE